MAVEFNLVRRWFERAPQVKLALFYGLGSGLLCLPANLVSRVACTGWCPYRGLLGGLPLLFMPFIAALLVSLFADWRVIPYDTASRVGIDIGLRTGLLAAVSGFLVIAATEIGILLLEAAQIASASGFERVLLQVGFRIAVSTTVYTIIFAVIFAVLGTFMGILGGSLGAALKRSPNVA